ncbi:MAG: GGDEF domain-containing protein [Eubacteriales bacterium]|nr:GGDEF domain-containing protein [Eubacteriales bacterium]
METYKIVDRLNLEAESIEKSTPLKMLTIAEEAYELAVSVNYQRGIAKSSLLQGRAHLRLGNMQDSESFLTSALEYNKSDLDLEAEIFNALGNVYVYLEIFDKAYDYYQRSLNLAIKTNNKTVESRVLNNVGAIFRTLGDFESALSYYQKSLETQEEIADFRFTSIPLSNLCEIYLDLHDLDNASLYASRALMIAQKDNDKMIQSVCNSYLGLIEKNRGHFDKALSYFNDSLVIYDETKERFHVAEIYIEFSKVYFETKNYKTAMEFLQKSSAVAEEIDAKSLQYSIYQQMSEVNQAIGNIDLTLLYAHKALETKKSMEDEEKQQKLRNIKFRKEAALTEKEKESYRILNAELELQTKQLREAYSTLKAVSDIGKQLTSTLDLPIIYKSVNQHIQNLMPCDVFGIALFNETNNTIEYQYLMEDDILLESTALLLDQKTSFAVYCFKNAEAFIVNSINEDTSKYTDGRSSSFGKAMPAFMFQPLILHGKTIGVLTVQSKIENVYSNNTLSTLGTISSYLSIAISNAKNAEDMQSLNKELSLLSKKDGLTGIFNKRFFNEIIAQLWSYAMRNQEPLSVLMIDIDYFKQYNDLYGHLSGDEALKTIAVLIEKNVKRSCDVVARFGGDEFVVLLSNTDRLGALQVADSIMTSIRDEGIVNEGSCMSPYLTVSIGCATMIPQVDSTPEQLIEKSDLSLYRAKETGRNSVSLH